MQLEHALKEAGSNGAFAEMGRAYGLSPDQTQALVLAVLPEFSRRIERNTLSRGGLADLVESVGNPRFRQALDQPAMLTSPEVRSAGIDVLDKMLGSKDRSRALAARAAQSTGLSEIIIKQLLPIIASMIMGSLSKSGGGALDDILSKIPGLPGARSGPSSAPAPAPQSGGGWSGFPLPGGRAPTPSAPAGYPDSAGGPLPLPGSHTPLDSGSGGNPYGDLSDVIRKGGGGGVGTSGGLAGIIRSVLGTLLGFQSGGVISWILRAVVMRYGWSILRTIFGRVLLGR